MRILIAGATGTIGRRLLPLLVNAGHDVTGTTRRRDGAAAIRAAGARPVIVDAFDRDAFVDALAVARPEVVIHQLTDLGPSTGGPITDEQLARTARLRSIGTANLMEAAAAAGTARVVAQSLALLYVPGPEPHVEIDPLGISEPWMAITLPGILELERLVTSTPGVDGIVLRYGLLYGPGAATPRPSGPTTVHVDDAAGAAALAVDHGTAGVFNIVDDGGPVANAKARVELGWTPRMPPAD